MINEWRRLARRLAYSQAESRKGTSFGLVNGRGRRTVTVE